LKLRTDFLHAAVPPIRTTPFPLSQRLRLHRLHRHASVLSGRALDGSHFLRSPALCGHLWDKDVRVNGGISPVLFPPFVQDLTVDAIPAGSGWSLWRAEGSPLVGEPTSHSPPLLGYSAGSAFSHAPQFSLFP